MLSWVARARPWLALAAVVLVVGVLVPPAGGYARQYVFVQALQFVIFAVVAPALLVLGVPRRLTRLAGRLSQAAGASPGPARRLGPSGRPGVLRAAAALVPFIALVVVLEAGGRPVPLSKRKQASGGAAASGVPLPAQRARRAHAASVPARASS